MVCILQETALDEVVKGAVKLLLYLYPGHLGAPNDRCGAIPCTTARTICLSQLGSIIQTLGKLNSLANVTIIYPGTLFTRA